MNFNNIKILILIIIIIISLYILYLIFKQIYYNKSNSFCSVIQPKSDKILDSNYIKFNNTIV